MKKAAIVCALVAAACSKTAYTPAPAAVPAAVTAAAGEYGSSAATAIEVCEPQGEREYLSRLRCADGKAPAYVRRGSGGMRSPILNKEHEAIAMAQIDPERILEPGEPDFHVVDYYQVTCSDRTVTLLLDMYHCQVPANQAPPGFTIVAK